MDEWSGLRSAATNLNTPSELLIKPGEPQYPGDHGYRLHGRARCELRTVIEQVPRLLDAYAELWELSQALLASVEQWKAQGEGSRLLVADESDMRNLYQSDPPPF